MASTSALCRLLHAVSASRATTQTARPLAAIGDGDRLQLGRRSRREAQLVEVGVAVLQHARAQPDTAALLTRHQAVAADPEAAIGISLVGHDEVPRRIRAG